MLNAESVHIKYMTEYYSASFCHLINSCNEHGFCQKQMIIQNTYIYHFWLISGAYIILARASGADTHSYNMSIVVYIVEMSFFSLFGLFRVYVEQLL